MAKKKVFAVFGLGSFGREVCRVLSEKGTKVIAFDNQSQHIDRIKDIVNQSLLLDSTDEETLKSAPLEDVDVAVVAIGDDIEASILTTALLKNIGIPYILARAVSNIHLQVLKQIGANEVINLEIEEGRRIASRLVSPEILDVIPVDQDYSIAELYVPKSLVGKSLQQVDLRKEFNLNIIAIQRSRTSIDEVGNPVKEEMVILPGSNDVFQSDDILLVIGRNQYIERFKKG